MDDQLGLFDRPAPHARNSATSKAAANAIESQAKTLRGMVLMFLRGRGEATDEEMQEFMGLSANTQRPRRVELVEKGLVLDSGRVRKTKAGRNATVWIPAPIEETKP